MRLLVGSIVAALVMCATASADLTPTRSSSVPAPITALSVTDRSIAYAVGETATSCGYVGVWEPALRFHIEVGRKTIVGCKERPSGGFGITSVSVAGRRVFWLTHIGGNITDWRLWTATPTRTSPRLLAAASAETDGPAPIVVGSGTRAGVPYAVGDTVTYVAPSGARLFRTTLGSPVRLLAAGRYRGGTGVLAALEDGRVVLLSPHGRVLGTESYPPGQVTAIALGVLGPVVQSGVEVRLRSTRSELPAGARMLDYYASAVYYRSGREIRSRHLVTGVERRLLTLPVRPFEPALFSNDNWGAAWATGRSLNWSTWLGSGS